MSGRVLVVDDQAANVRLLEAKLEAEYFDVDVAYDGHEALERARADQPDLILLDVMMPGLDGYETCRQLKADPATRHIPVIMVTALDQREDRVAGLESGADDFLTKPVDDLTLFARVRSLMRLKLVLDELRVREQSGAGELITEMAEEPAEGARVVVAAGEERAGQRYRRGLGEGVKVDIFYDPGEAARAVVAGADLFLVDLTTPRFDGLRLCARIRSDAHTRQTPIIAVIAPDDVALAVKALDLGVNDIIHRPVDPGELTARARTQLRRKTYTDRLRSRLDASLEMAVTDPLTGLHNRRYIASRLRQAMDMANNGGAPVSVMLADIDHFKRVNDTYGHEGGDIVLRDFAKRLGGALRALDLAARYGGEEFVIVMPGAGQAEAEAAAERLRAIIAAEPFDLGGGERMKVTVSIGVAQALREEEPESLMRRADQALYRAKADGRNRVEAADQAA
jgi:two-component system cell cycle response regulator